MLIFLKVFDNPLSKYLILEIISCMQCLFCVIYNNKKRSGTSFGTDFLYDFSIKIFLISCCVNCQSFNVIPFFRPKISMKCVIKFLFRQLMMPWTFKIYLGSSPKAMTDREKKRGRWKYKNLNILQTKELFRWKKSSFIVFEWLLFGEK